MYLPSPRSGFTLPELLISIAIISILSSISIPMILAKLPEIRLKKAARDVYTNMQETKIQAIKYNQNRAIVFDTVNNRYYICSDWGVDKKWAGVGDDTGTGDNVIVETVSLDAYKSGITFGSGSIQPEKKVSFTKNVATFNPRGTCKSGYIYLENEKNNSTLRVGTLSSGNIIIRSWRGNHWD